MTKGDSMAEWGEMLAAASPEHPGRALEVVIHPPRNGVWPGGEPCSIRDRADELARDARKGRTQ